MRKLLSVFVLSIMAVCVCQVSWAETVCIFSFKGDVKVVPRGRNVGIECEKGMVLNSGDWVKTGSGAAVTLAFDKEGENVIAIEENSLVIIKMDGYFKIQLLTGEIYAILENVQHGESFRVLTPSAVTEATTSGWGARSDGTYTNVVAFDNKVFICGINRDGSVKKDKFWVEEGYQRKTVNFEDPGELEPVPETLLSWFKEQLVVHHLSQKMAKESAPKEIKKNVAKQVAPKAVATVVPGAGTDVEKPIKYPNNNMIVADGQEINLVDFLYKQRLKQMGGAERASVPEEKPAQK